MDRALALDVLGLKPDATAAEIERAYQQQRAELRGRIDIAPTEGIKQFYRESLEKLDQAVAILRGGSAPRVGAGRGAGGPPKDAKPASAGPEPSSESFDLEEFERSLEEVLGGEETGGQVGASAKPEAPTVVAPTPSEPRRAEPQRTKVHVEETSARPKLRKVVVEPDQAKGALSAEETQIGFLEGRLLAGRYELRRRLGIGRMGALYAAFDRASRSDVGVRMFLPGLVENDVVRERLLKELSAWIHLSHPNIARVIEVQQDDTLFFVVMELPDGKTLRDTHEARARVKGLFTILEVQQVGSALCDALSYAHQHTVHGQIGPESIFLGSNGSVKLLDFGGGGVMGRGPSAAKARGGDTGGYTAPEQLDRGAPPDELGDQYSLAAVLYEMLTGRIPAVPVQPVRSLRHDVPAGLASTLERGLERAAKDRFPDMRAFGISLKGGHAISLPGSRQLWMVVGGAVVVVAAVGGIAYTLLGRREPSRPAEVAVKRATAVSTQPPAKAEPDREATAKAEAEIEGAKARQAKVDAERTVAQAKREAEEAAEQAKQDAVRRAEEARAQEGKKSETERLAAARAQVESERAAAQAKMESDRMAVAVQEAMRQKATEAASEAARLATARAEAERTITARVQAEAQRTAVAQARLDVQRTATAQVKADAERTATAKAEAEAERVKARVDAEATARVQAEADRTATIVAEKAATARAEAAKRRIDIPSLDATVVSLRFFEKSQKEQVPEGQRVFSEKFKGSKSRAIFWELALAHPPQGRTRYVTIHSVCYRPNGDVFGEGDLNSYVEGSWGKSTHVYGWGFAEPGSWESGTYRVELTVDGKKIASGSFKID